MKKQNGITLVALIITIVLLLILAAVSITAIQDDGGLVDKANGAVNKWNDAQNKEESILQEYGNSLDGYTGCKHTDGVIYYTLIARWKHNKHLRCPDCKIDILVCEEQCTDYQGDVINNWGYCSKCGQS